MIDEAGRKRRFEQWEKLGLDRVKHDLLNGGFRLVGGTPEVRELAWEWVRMKEAEQAEAAQKKEADLAKAAQKPPEIVTLKPSLWGFSLDLKALWRRIFGRTDKP